MVSAVLQMKFEGPRYSAEQCNEISTSKGGLIQVVIDYYDTPIWVGAISLGTIIT